MTIFIVTTNICYARTLLFWRFDLFFQGENMQDIKGYTLIQVIKELVKDITLWECEKNGNSYEFLHICHIEKYKVMLDGIWLTQIKPVINKDIIGIQKIVDGGWDNEDFFIVYENSEEISNHNSLEIMKNIAIGLNELWLGKKLCGFMISPQNIKNKLQFIGLFELFKKLDLLDKEYLSPNVNEWLNGIQGTYPPKYQDDIYSLVKSFEEILREVDNDKAKEILDKGLAGERTKRFGKHCELIDLLSNICQKKLQVVIKGSPTDEFLQVLEEMNKDCELSIESEKTEKDQIAVRFYTKKWQGIFFVDKYDDYVFIPVQNCKQRNDSRNNPNWFGADFSFSLDEKSTFKCRDYFTERFYNINQLANLNKTKGKTVEKWRIMPEEEKKFIEKNAFCVSYNDVEFRRGNAIFSLTGNLNDKTWETMKEHKREKTSLYTALINPPNPLDGMIKIGNISEFHSVNKKLVIKDILCKEDEIFKKGSLTEDISQKISQFKKQMEACERFLMRNVLNPNLCSILANPDTAPIPSSNDSKELKDWDYEDFKKEVFNNNLQTDETQLKAVLEAISYKPLYLIQGPPGTGKTTVIVECIRQIIEREPNSKILITSQSNLAVDNVLEKIAEVKPELKFMRLASESEDREINVTESIKPHTYETKLKKWADGTIKNHKIFMENKFSTQEKNNVLYNFYKTVREIADTEFSKFKEELNGQPNNYIKKLFEDSKTMENVREIFKSVFGEEYLKLKGIEEEWIALLNNITKAKLNNGSEERGFLPAMTEDMSIIGATCIHIASSKYRKINFKFDYVIMDESSKASPAEALVPINMGRNIILIGDHKQLPPVVTREEAVKEELKKELDDNGLDIEKEFGESLFEKLITAFETNDDKQKHIRMLNIQYRMPRQIGSLISKNFYDGKLNNPLPEVIPDFDKKHEHGLKLKKNTSIIFLSTSKREKPNDNGNKFKRENECNMKYIKEILEKLNELYANNLQKEKPFTIGIIAGYRGQVELLRKNINREQYKHFVIDKNGDKNCLIEINTVDKFQGAERDIIIYDIVRSESNNTNIGFLADDRRVNVAFSRAKRLLIIVGDNEYVKRARRNPGEEGIFKKFKLQDIVKDLEKDEIIFNNLEEVF